MHHMIIGYYDRDVHAPLLSFPSLNILILRLHRLVSLVELCVLPLNAIGGGGGRGRERRGRERKEERKREMINWASHNMCG